MRIIPKNTKIKITFYRGITVADIVLGLTALALIAITLSSNLSFKFYLAIGVIIVAVPLFVSVSGERLYKLLGHLLKHLASRKKYLKSAKDKANVEGIVPYEKILDNDLIQNKDGTYVGVLEVNPVDFDMLSEFQQDSLIDNTFAPVLNLIGFGQQVDIVKLERPLILDNYISDEMERLACLISSYEHGELNEKEYQSRADIIQDRIQTVDAINTNEKIFYSRYYLAFHGADMKELGNTVNRAASNLYSSGIAAKRLDKKELAAFLRYSIDEKFDERELQNAADYSACLSPDEVSFTLTNVRQNNKTLTYFAITNYPLKVCNAWGEGLFDIPHTKVVMKLKPVEKFKALKRIDSAILEIQTQNQRNRASDIIDRETHLESLQDLLNSLQNDNDTLFDTTLIIAAYDEKGKSAVKRQVRQRLKEMGFGYTELIGRQQEAHLTVNITMLDKLGISRGIQSSGVAACFPFVSNAVVDDKGIMVGENKLPVFVDFFKRDNERINSNMVVIGKSGSGKSYAIKTIIAQFASCNTKVFILDPDNEYTNLAHNLGGKALDVSSAKYGKLNPFHIIGSIDDENNDGTSNDFFAHLQFLEEFYRVVLPGINADSFELLNKLTQELYQSKGINAQSDISKLAVKDYPVFDDLANLIDNRLAAEKDEYNRGCLKVLTNYVAKFKEGGRYSNLWNGETTFNPQENFVSFEFKKLFANKNIIVANAQMLLVLKWLENEVIKNRDFNLKNGTKRKIVVAIDEAHIFIDEKFPVAIDFMYQLSKRIRKYEGMFIFITQNVKDFAGTPDIARKSTAIINLSQYSLIFSLSPNDMTELCKLYEHAGQINQAETEYIVHNKCGTAFLISSPKARTNIDIVASEFIASII